MGTYEDHEDRRGEPEEGPTTSTIYDREHGANKRICYFYDNDYAGMYYGADHPMKPPPDRDDAFSRCGLRTA